MNDSMVKLGFTIAAIGCFVGAALLPAAAVPLAGLGSAIVGSVWVPRPGDTRRR